MKIRFLSRNKYFVRDIVYCLSIVYDLMEYQSNNGDCMNLAENIIFILKNKIFLFRE